MSQNLVSSSKTDPRGESWWKTDLLRVHADQNGGRGPRRHGPVQFEEVQQEEFLPPVKREPAALESSATRQEGPGFVL